MVRQRVFSESSTCGSVLWMGWSCRRVKAISMNYSEWSERCWAIVMVTMSSEYSIYLYREKVDLRKGISGLSGIVRSEMKMNPQRWLTYVLNNIKTTPADQLPNLLAAAELWQESSETCLNKRKTTRKNTAKALNDRLCFAALVLLCQYGCVGTVTLQRRGITRDVQAEMADWDFLQRAQEQWLQHWKLSRQNPRTYGQSICHRNACICLVLHRWYLYSRKHQEDEGSASWQKIQKPLQIRTGVYRTVPPELHEPLSDRYFQIFVIYLDNF